MTEGPELWRECVQWMIECGVLDPKHRVAEPDAQLHDFALILRDGVLLCVLCNRLCENCIDSKDLQQRPQMAQFLCCKNICEFLKACQNTFEMKADDLFDPWDLYYLNDFAKVLQTLSKLSKTSTARLSGSRGFPLHNLATSASDYYNEEAIYKNLREDAETIAENTESAYDLNIAEEEQKSGRIYDTIVCQKSSSQRELKTIEHDKWANFKPETRREHCIKELYDTETNYLEKALDMIINKFYAPLEEVLSPDDHRIIFMNIVELACIHRSFREHLRQAVFHTLGLENHSADERAVNIGDVFITWKEKFVAYGEYCSKLSASRSRICQLEKTDPVVRQKIIECGQAANRNQFHLQDLLSVPMQRVLKYHVLLSEMIKLTSVESSDRLALEEAKEAMQDINNYVNEMKRDYEMQQLIYDIEKSIVDLEMPENMHLLAYGRLVRNGALKIALPNRESSRPKNRYVFVFDKVMIVCKSLRNNQYSFKNAHILQNFRVEVESENNNKFGTLTRKLTTDGGHFFSLIEDKCESANIINIFCRTPLQRDAWVHDIEQAKDNVRPKDMEASGHSLLYKTYEKANVCCHCQKLLAGLFFQGYHCTSCAKNFHRSCITMSKCSGLCPPHTKGQSISRRKHTSLQPNECVRAVRSFQSNDPRMLSFEENDLIEIIERNADGTLMGRLVLSPNRCGLVQAEYVRKYRLSTSSLHSLMSSSSLSSPALSTISGQRDACEPPQLPRAIMNNERISSVSSVSLDSTMPSRSPQHCDYVNVDVIGQNWYQGPLERREAESRLRGTPDGSYLVRFSRTQQQFVISISFNNDVKHTKIEYSPNGRYYLDESTMFPSIVELINYYKEHNLRESFESLNTTLRHAFPIDRPYTAIHNFEATDANFLALVVGQRVYVISRTGEDRGWWKGRSGNKVFFYSNFQASISNVISYLGVFEYRKKISDNS